MNRSVGLAVAELGPGGETGYEREEVVGGNRTIEDLEQDEGRRERGARLMDYRDILIMGETGRGLPRNIIQESC